MQKSVYLITGILLILNIIPLAAATLAVDPLQAVYNIGDDVTLEFTVTRATSAHGFLTADLMCAEGSTEIYKTPLRSTAGEQKKISIPTKLDRFLIGTLRRGCTIFIEYGGESARSTPFEISSEMLVRATPNESVVQPGRHVSISGGATKRNGKTANGILDMFVTDMNISASASIRDGVFNITFPLATNARAQTYVVNLHAYERDSEGMLSNEGKTIVSFKVPQVLTTHDVAIDNSKLNPQESLGYRVFAYDQAEEPMALESSVRLTAPDGKSMLDERIHTGELRHIQFSWNATPGSWTLEATTGSMKRTREILMNAVRNVTFSLDNDTLIIRNFGNVPFSDVVRVSIGGEPRDVNVELGVGGSARFKLFAPQGIHEVDVQGGNHSATFGNVFLTGKSVDVRNADSRTWAVAPWIWWMILILVAASVALHFYRKFRRRTTWGRTPRSFNEEQKSSHTRTLAHPVDAISNSSGGRKEECVIVALYAKNLAHAENSDGPAAETIQRVVTQAKNARAAVYTQGSHKIMIFTQAVGNSGQAAVSLARDVERILMEHNRQYAMKLGFGIGINKGEMIVEMHAGKPRFTSVGTTVIGAKRLAEQAKESVFVGDDVYRSLIGKIKVEKVNEKTWKLKNQSSVGRNAEFLKRFMNERS